MRYCIDLHNHSCLSPCASDTMLPTVIVKKAVDRGIDILALTDHNNARNTPSFAKACTVSGITGIYGLEVTSKEEVHVLTLFATVQEALAFSSFIESLLPPIQNDPLWLGNQWLVGTTENDLTQFDTCLAAPSDISFDLLVKTAIERGALVIPAHIDREFAGVFANLGFLPDFPYAAVESIMVPPVVPTREYAVIQGSDAHLVEHIGRRSCFIEADEPSFCALKEALEAKKVSYRGTRW